MSRGLTCPVLKATITYRFSIRSLYRKPYHYLVGGVELYVGIGDRSKGVIIPTTVDSLMTFQGPLKQKPNQNVLIQCLHPSTEKNLISWGFRTIVCQHIYIQDFEASLSLSLAISTFTVTCRYTCRRSRYRYENVLCIFRELSNANPLWIGSGSIGEVER